MKLSPIVPFCLWLGLGTLSNEVKPPPNLLSNPMSCHGRWRFWGLGSLFANSFWKQVFIFKNKKKKKTSQNYSKKQLSFRISFKKICFYNSFQTNCINILTDQTKNITPAIAQILHIFRTSSVHFQNIKAFIYKTTRLLGNVLKNNSW